MSRAWMPLYIGDYRADTAHLRVSEHGAYLLLIMHYWQHGSLPNDDERLASIASATPQEWSSIKPVIRGFFDHKWRHKRIDRERIKSDESAKRRAESGRKGGLAKASNATAAGIANEPSNATACAHVSQSQLVRESLHLDLDPTEITKIHPSIQSCPSQTWTSLFDEFWQAWPNKVGKPAARKVFERLAKCPEFDYEAIIAGIERYERQKPTDRPWLNPATFLNQERWNDEPATTSPPKSTGKSNGTRGAIEGFLNGESDPTGCKKSTSKTVPLLPAEWRRE
jgi:uncharacterized protein YdaU (DUF1376 family)